MKLFSVVLLLFSFFFTGSCPASPGDDEKKVTWMEADALPFFIHNGTNNNQGYGDVVTNILKEKLSGYTHFEESSTLARHLYKFHHGEQVCSVGLFITPERQDFMYFSIPSFLTMPNVLIISKDRFEDFGGSKTVSLAELLDRGAITIGRGKTRSYGRYIDTILTSHKGDKILFEYEGEELSENFFKMLRLGRLDALIGLPDEAMYQAERFGMADEIMTLTIEENQVGYSSWLSSVACPKNEWGQKMIAEIDAILLAERSTERYRKAYERWLDASSLEEYRKLYDRVFLAVPVAGNR